ncbi:MAG: hypothetical protein PHR96_00485 [Clostridia bacterium]|nr:hypothetical protein [Clostridia bacterium]
MCALKVLGKYAIIRAHGQTFKEIQSNEKELNYQMKNSVLTLN